MRYGRLTVTHEALLQALGEPEGADIMFVDQQVPGRVNGTFHVYIRSDALPDTPEGNMPMEIDLEDLHCGEGRTIN